MSIQQLNSFIEGYTKRAELAGFIKTARPAWVERFLNLSPEDQQRIISLKLNERTLKPLGGGSSRISDLVVHPSHGLAVRKIPKIPMGDDSAEIWKNLSDVLEKNESQIKAEKYLSELAKGEGHFAHLLEGTPRKAYYQYAQGAPTQKHLELEKVKDQILRLEAQKAPFMQRMNLHKRLGDMYREEIPLPDASEKIWREFKKKYPRAYDRRLPNYVGNTLIDFEPGDVPIVGTNFLGMPTERMSDNEVRRGILGRAIDKNLDQIKDPALAKKIKDRLNAAPIIPGQSTSAAASAGETMLSKARGALSKGVAAIRKRLGK